MHRERKRDIAVVILVGVIVLPLEWILAGWLGVFLFSFLMLAAFLFMPPEELYVRRDILLAKQEFLKKLEGIQTTISEHMDVEKENDK